VGDRLGTNLLVVLLRRGLAVVLLRRGLAVVLLLLAVAAALLVVVVVLGGHGGLGVSLDIWVGKGLDW
jgi:hypothetical protein